MSKAKLTLVRAGVDRSRMVPHDKLTSGGNDGGDMDGNYVTHTEFQEAVSGINERFARIETRLDQFATKADLAEFKNQFIMWIVGTAIAMATAGITVMTFVLNNATPKAPSPVPQPPIIIHVPAPVNATTSSPPPPPSVTPAP